LWLNDIDRTGGGSRSTPFRAGKIARMGNGMPVSVKLVAAMALSILAFGARTFTTLAWLSGAELLFLFLFCSKCWSPWRKARGFLWQTAIIVLLHIIRFGPVEGLWPGLRISWQLFLAFLPGMVFIETTPESQVARVMARVMPCRAAFVLTTCLRFIPLVIDEVKSIYEGQAMRGARILPKDVLKPWNWPDVVHCLLVPAIVQCMSLAGEIALAARARNFGARSKRTAWPGT